MAWDQLVQESARKPDDPVKALTDLAAGLGWQALALYSAYPDRFISREELREIVGFLHLQRASVERVRKLLCLPFPGVRGIALPALDELVADLLRSSLGPLDALAFEPVGTKVSARALEELFADVRFRGVQSSRRYRQ